MKRFIANLVQHNLCKLLLVESVFPEPYNQMMDMFITVDKTIIATVVGKVILLQ